MLRLPACVLSRVLAVLLPAVVIVTSASGQTKDQPSSLVLSSLGIEVRVPAGAVAQDNSRSEQVDLNLIDGGSPAAWSLRLTSMLSPIGEAPAVDQITYLLERQRAKVALDPEQSLLILVNDPIRCGRHFGQLCFVDTTNAKLGWFCVPLEGDLVLLATIQARADTFDETYPALVRFFSDIRVPDLKALADARKARLEAGRAFLNSIAPERLQAAAGRSQWYRTFRPGRPGRGEEEVACYLIETSAAPRGAVNPQRAPESYTAIEKEEGLLVQLYSLGAMADARDSLRIVGAYWVAWDQSSETWSVRQTFARGRQKDSTAIMGNRTPRSTGATASGQLHLIRSSQNGNVREAPAPAPVPPSYFSQPLRWIEGEIFNRPEPAPALELSYYCVDSSGAKLAVTPRVDRIESVSPGKWRVVSRPRPDGPVTESIYDPTGRLIERTWPDGTRTRPIELATLVDLWKRKGIATAPLKERGVRRQRGTPRSR